MKVNMVWVHSALDQCKEDGVIREWSSGATGGAHARTFFDVETSTGDKYRFFADGMAAFLAGVLAKSEATKSTEG